jgi:hypothetical protein
MFEFIDVNALLMGLLFGLVLSVTIVIFLVHAAINAPQPEEDRSRAGRFGTWKPAARYENRRSYLHVGGHDPEVYEW